MKILRGSAALQRLLHAWRMEGESIALVPTMGNLHAGHQSLMALARRHADRVVASIFVNPTQFGPQEDYATYPRTPRHDAAGLRAAGVDALFAPVVKTLYPTGAEQATIVSVPGLSTELCGAHRPGHFDGVASVVLRLFNIVVPDVAVFGEKDYQQLVLLRRMTRDLHLDIRLVGGPIVREPDGLAMSSRNQYLDAGERELAPQLYRVLGDCRRELLDGEWDFAGLERRARRRLLKLGFQPDYVAIRDARDLSVPEDDCRRLRVLAAARLGNTRLIDNIGLRLP